MTAQGDRQASVRAITGTAWDYNGDFSALFDQAGIPAGAWDGRFLAWINQFLGTSYTELNGAMQALATANGAYNFSSLGTFNAAVATALLNFLTSFYLNGGSSTSNIGALTGWSFSRASVGYAANLNGSLTSFASGAPRITNEGLLIEAASTNLLLQSVDLTQAAWTVSGDVVTSPGITAPDGSATAQQVVVNGNSFGPYQLISGTINPGDEYTLSVWLASASPQVINVMINGATAPANAAGVYVNVTPTWQRVSLTSTMVADTGLYFIPASANSTNTPGAQPIPTQQTLYIWNPQAEKAAAPSSDIRTTTAAATRAADAASLTFTGSPANAAVTYGAGLVANTASPSSPFNLGASSGGAWVGSYVSKLLIK
jgi:hypothetical protein